LSWLKLAWLRSARLLIEKLLVVVAELLQDVLIVEELLNGAAGLREQVFNRLAALGPVVLPEIRVQEPKKS